MVTEALWFVAGGLALTLIAFFLRGAKRRLEWNLDRKYYRLLLLSAAGSVLAFVGFFQLSRGPASENPVDSSQVLTVFSLLASGIIAGYFNFTFDQAAEDEQFFPSALSISFILLFHLVFAAISFYIGKSKIMHAIEGVNIIVPLIMLILLLSINVREFWDYRKAPPKP